MKDVLQQEGDGFSSNTADGIEAGRWRQKTLG